MIQFQPSLFQERALDVDCVRAFDLGRLYFSMWQFFDGGFFCTDKEKENVSCFCWTIME